jgi:signal transduction histidine kinase
MERVLVRALRSDALVWSMKSFLLRHQREAVIAAVTIASLVLYSIWTLVIATAVADKPDGSTFGVLGLRVRKDLFVALLGAFALAMSAAVALNSILARLYGEIDRARERTIRQETVVYMASTMAHEVFQPLTIIQAGVQFLCRHQLPPERQKELCDRVVKSTRTLAEIIRRFESSAEAATREHDGTRLIGVDDRSPR